MWPNRAANEAAEYSNKNTNQYRQWQSIEWSIRILVTSIRSCAGIKGTMTTLSPPALAPSSLSRPTNCKAFRVVVVSFTSLDCTKMSPIAGLLLCAIVTLGASYDQGFSDYVASAALDSNVWAPYYYPSGTYFYASLFSSPPNAKKNYSTAYANAYEGRNRLQPYNYYFKSKWHI